MGAAGWTPGGTAQGFHGFGDAIFKVCWAPTLGVLICLWACFQVIFLPIFNSKFRRLELLEPGVRMEGIAKANFSDRSLLKGSGSICFVFWKPWEQF